MNRQLPGPSNRDELGTPRVKLETGDMDKIPVKLTGVRLTAVFEHYLRWLDRPDDALTAQSIKRLDSDFSQLKPLRMGRFVVGARSRLMDNWICQYLAGNPSAVVVDLGCGIDRRVERVNPQPRQHWYDIDFAEVIELAGQLYGHRDGHTAIGADVTTPGWLAALPSDKPAAVVADGLFNFLDESEVRQILRGIVGHVPSGEIYFNITGSVVRKQRARRPVLLFAKYGISEKWFLDDPRDVERCDPRLHLVQAQSQIAASFVSGDPFYYRLLCAVLRAMPILRNSGWVLRYRFGTGFAG